MAQGNAPKSDIYFVPDRENAPWYRTGAIWATRNPDIDSIEIELLNPATGEAIRLHFMVKKHQSKQETGA